MWAARPSLPPTARRAGRRVSRCLLAWQTFFLSLSCVAARRGGERWTREALDGETRRREEEGFEGRRKGNGGEKRVKDGRLLLPALLACCFFFLLQNTQSGSPVKKSLSFYCIQPTTKDHKPFFIPRAPPSSEPKAISLRGCLDIFDLDPFIPSSLHPFIPSFP